jgi:hypothetical protein
VSQNKSDFQESFLIKCKFKLFKSWSPGIWEGPQ